MLGGEPTYRDFFTLLKKLKGKNPKFFGLSAENSSLVFKKPQASANFKHMTIFVGKNSKFIKQ